VVNLEEIKKDLKKLKSNREILIYLNGLLDKVEDKKLLKEIKFMINNFKELDAISQIKTKGRVEWSLPEEESVGERRLETQVVGVPVEREEKKDEKEIKYSLGSDVNLYREGTRGSDVKYEGTNRLGDTDGGNSFIEGRVNQQYRGEDFKKSHEDIMGEGEGLVRYHSLEGETVDYAPASVSEEVHKKARKKPLH